MESFNLVKVKAMTIAKTIDPSTSCWLMPRMPCLGRNRLARNVIKESIHPSSGARSRFVFELASIRCALPPPSRLCLQCLRPCHCPSPSTLTFFFFPFFPLPNFLSYQLHTLLPSNAQSIVRIVVLPFDSLSLIPFATLAPFVVLTICLSQHHHHQNNRPT